MVDTPPEVPGHPLGRPLGGRGLYVASSPAGDEVCVELTDPAVRPTVVTRALAAREQAAQARVTSEHVLRLREVVALDGEVVALVRDPAGGGTLADLLARRGALSPGEVTTVLTPLATTLAELDAAGVVHGSISPAHVFLTASGMPLLGGFETVRLVGEPHRHGGTGPPGFEAPEVAQGSVPTPASDAWSLGALGWCCLTGSPPPADAARRAAEVLGAPAATALAPLLEPDPAHRARAAVSAGRLYRSAPPVPVRLEPDPPPGGLDVVGRDDALWGEGAVVRTAWGEHPRSASSASPGTTSWSLTGAPVAGPGDGADVAPLLLRRTVRAPAAAAAPGRRGLSTPARVAVLALAVVVFVGGFVTVLARRPAGEPGAWLGSSRPAAAAGVVGADPDAQGDATPTELLQGLVDARAAAVTSRDVAGLERAELGSSPPRATDAALIGRLVAAGQTYAGLRFVVRDVSVLSRSGTRMELRAVVARDGYALVGDDGTRSSRPGEQGSPYLYQLVRTRSGWRLGSLVEQPAPAATPSTPATG